MSGKTKKTGDPDFKEILKNSKYEAEFSDLWVEMFPDIDLVWNQVIILPDFGKKEVDFYHSRSQTIIEIHGAIYTNGSHTFGKGFERDRWFSFCCQKHGCAILEITPSQITRYTLQEIAGIISERTKKNSLFQV